MVADDSADELVEGIVESLADELLLVEGRLVAGRPVDTGNAEAVG